MTTVLGEGDLDARQRTAHRHVVDQPARSRRRGGERAFPSIIISANDKRLAVRAEVPGMRLEDFEISVSGDLLTIRGSRQTGGAPGGAELAGGWYHRREREQGDFSRSVRLPANVDGTRAEASYMSGVLTVALPLIEPAKPRHVRVRVAGQ